MRLIFCLAVLFVGWDSGPIAAQVPEIIDQEPEIKAAYLYNFGRYVDWPADAPRGKFTIGVIGQSSVVAPLGKIAQNKQVKQRPIDVQTFKAEKDFQKCDLLFVPAGQDPRLVAAILKAAGKSATLIVGEEPNFALNQGHIGFYTTENNVKFEINNKAAGNAGLKISAKLLNLGRIVVARPGK